MKKAVLFIAFIVYHFFAFSQSDDFTDSDISMNPVWSGNSGNFSTSTSSPILNGNALTDGHYLMSNGTGNNHKVCITTPSIITSQWKFSLGSTNYDPSDTNYLGVVLMSDMQLAVI